MNGVFAFGIDRLKCGIIFAKADKFIVRRLEQFDAGAQILPQLRRSVFGVIMGGMRHLLQQHALAAAHIDRGRIMRTLAEGCQGNDVAGKDQRQNNAQREDVPIQVRLKNFAPGMALLVVFE